MTVISFNLEIAYINIKNKDLLTYILYKLRTRGVIKLLLLYLAAFLYVSGDFIGRILNKLLFIRRYFKWELWF